MKIPTKTALLLALSLVACQSSETQPVAPDSRASRRAEPLPTVAEKTERLSRREGLFDVYLDEQEGRAWLRLPPAGPVELGRVMFACLWVEGLASGFGSNDVGLDRGQLGQARVVTWRRFGDRVLMEQPNLDYRARSQDEEEVAATRNSFASSVLFAADIVAEDADGSALIELTPFLLQDAHDVARTLASSGEGSWRLDAKRSSLDVEACLAFPDNLEFESLLTFAGEKPGRYARTHAPSADTISLVQHHSFVRLPDDGFESRAFDPRMGHFGPRFLDYGSKIEQPLEVHLAARHRLWRSDPAKQSSSAVEPIVYYVDRGAPEPIRSALIEGASWWAEAFEAAGYRDAFRVELLPVGAHPLDVRYNVIQWVHRSTRGWSYGGGVIDPRTGEFLKGHVTLGSLRVRQDRLLFEGLLGSGESGSGSARDPVQLALARIRQLAAHEVGHTLGLAHNFSASTYGGRASVMDYPAPLIGIGPTGEFDLSSAYAVGIGEWDKLAIRYLYSDWSATPDPAAAAEALATEARERGLSYHSDSDARPPGAAMPLANLWDNGTEPVGALIDTLAVRSLALERFDEQRLASGLPRGWIEEVFAPVYFHHRYQLEAALKTLGGVRYEHGLMGDGTPPMQSVSADEQRRALIVCLSALSPATLDIPEHVLELLVPQAPGDAGNVERFRGGAAPLFDPLGAAASAAGLVVDGLLQRERCARLVDQHRRHEELPGLEEVLDELVLACLPDQPAASLREQELLHTAQRVVVDGMLHLAADPLALPWVRERVEGRLRTLAEREFALRSAVDAAHYQELIGRIARFLARTRLESSPGERSPELPPGSPIGSPSGSGSWPLPEALGSCSFH